MNETFSSKNKKINNNNEKTLELPKIQEYNQSPKFQKDIYIDYKSP